MSIPSDRLKQEQRQSQSTQTPTGVRLKVRRGSEEELVEVSPAFRILQKNQVQQPTSTQWRDFSRSLAERLDKEASSKSRFRSIQTLRDKLTATDSSTLRVVGYVMLAVALGAIAAGIWIASSLALEAPTSQSSMQFTPAPISYMMPASTPQQLLVHEDVKAA